MCPSKEQAKIAMLKMVARQQYLKEKYGREAALDMFPTDDLLISYKNVWSSYANSLDTKVEICIR
jgi:hypothetical protein